MKHINLTDVQRMAENYADNKDSAWTNDYWAFIDGMRMVFKLIDVPVIDDREQYEFINADFHVDGLKKGDLCYVIDEAERGTVHVVVKNDIILPFTISSFEKNFRKVEKK